MLKMGGHSSVNGGGQIINGGVVSSTVIVCVHVVMFMQLSVALYVRTMTIGQVPVLIVSPTNVTVGVPQLSVAIKVAGSAGGGTSSMHSYVASSGHVIVGGVRSVNDITCTQLF
jgi:hypothetical protein